MYITNKPRATGKTYELIMDSAKTGATIISFNKSATSFVKEKAKSIGVKIPEPISFHEARGKEFPNGVLIDELRLCLQSAFGTSIVGATIDSETTTLLDLWQSK